MAREKVPASRFALRYALLRAFGGGQVYAALALRHSGANPVAMAARGLGQVVVMGLVALLLWPIPAARRRFGRAALTAAGGLGKLSWRRRLALYRQEAAERAGRA